MKILVVEDDQLNMEIICEALESEDYELIKAFNGLEALTLLKAHKDEIELILLDRMMPEMDGMTFLEESRKADLLGKIPVVMQTAAGSQKEVIEGAATGVYYYLTKPYDYKHLLAVVRSALDDAA